MMEHARELVEFLDTYLPSVMALVVACVATFLPPPEDPIAKWVGRTFALIFLVLAVWMYLDPPLAGRPLSLTNPDSG